MKRILFSVVALGVFVATAASAQHVAFSIGAGGVVPMGVFSDYDKAGWHGLGAVEVGIPASPLAVRVDYMYGQTGHDPASLLTGSTKLSGGTADLVYRLGAKGVPVRLYFVGGLGYYSVKVQDSGSGQTASESKVAFGGGTGITMGFAGAHLFMEGRWLSVQTSGSATTFLPVTLGMSFGM